MTVSLPINLRFEIRRAHLSVLLFILGFAAISIWGTPFLYDRGGSGRYLLEVIQAADPELFQGDSVVEALRRFDSLFYNTLAFVFSTAGISPTQLQPTMHLLYAISKVALFAGLFLLARHFSRSLSLFILLAAWAAHQKGAPVGGNTLFAPALTHASVAFLLGLLALHALLSKQLFWFWSLAGIAVLSHSLVALHFVVVVAPVYYLLRRPSLRQRWGLAGIALFVSFLVIYALFMAPPAMSAEEASIFLDLKGRMYHVSPFDHSLMDWFKALAGLALALFAYRRFLQKNGNYRLLAGFVISGAGIALFLALIATLAQPVRLVQFQPMRIFFWVWFFARFLIVGATIEAFHQRSPAAVLLLGVLLLEIAVSLWYLAFVGLALTYLIITDPLVVGRLKFTRSVRKKYIVWSLVGVAMLIAAGFLFGSIVGTSVETLKSPVPLLLAAPLLILALKGPTRRQWQQLLIGTAIVTALLAASFFRQAYYSVRLDSDWFAVQQWSRQHTEKADTFLITPGAGGNFRTRSFRTAVGEPMSALCWVDPLECRRNGQRVAQIKRARQDGTWRVATLAELARELNAQYILVAGPYVAAADPLFRAGNYSIFRRPSNL